MELIQHYDIRPSLTDPNLRTLDFANIFSAKFDRYLILFHGGRVDTNEGGFRKFGEYNFNYLKEDNTVDSTNVYTYQENGGYSANTSHQPIDFDDNVTKHVLGRFSSSAETTYPFMKMWINTPFNSDRRTTIHTQINGHDGTNYVYFGLGAGFHDATTRFTGFRLTNTSTSQANLYEGKLAVYGLGGG